ncbi:hypothetical protein NPIL_93991, partial [Nephila pilipes]
ELIQRVKEAFSASTFRSRNKGVKRELKEELIDADGSNCNNKRVKLEPKELMDVDSSNYNESENIFENNILSTKTPEKRNFEASEQLLKILEDMEKKLHYSQ